MASFKSLKFVTFRPTSQYFLCSNCLDNHQQRTHIVERESFEARTFDNDGVYTGSCIFKNVVNVTEEQQVHDINQEIKCVRCSNSLGSKYVQLPPLFAHRTGSFYLVTMNNVSYWDGDNLLNAEEGLPAVLAEQDPGHEAQVQLVDGHADNEDEDDEEFPPGAWFFWAFRL